ncbi:MSCRAMM family protein, partial [Pseudodonghicola flavimaris]
SGEDIDGLDFGNTKYGKISGIKYEDLDGDGTAGDNTPIPGWQISLYLDGDLNGNGVLDAGETADGTLNGEVAMATTATGADGSYLFDDLMLGAYFVAEEAPDGWVAITPATVGVDGGTSGFDETVDFYNFEKFDISGWKWSDLDGDAAWDAEETGVGGFTIVLDTDQTYGNGNEIDEVVTAADGSYSFTGLTPGTYYVYELDKAGWQQTYDGATVIVGESGVDHNGTEGLAELLNFGNQELFSVTGYKWEDANGNGLWDDGETVIEGWTFQLLDAAGAVIATTTTDETGRYLFENLTPGEFYSVQEVMPASGWTNTFDGSHSFTGAAGELVEGTLGETEVLNFGNFENFMISGHKWNDYDGDGTWDTGEDPIQGWTIYLDDNQDISDGVLATVQTDASGYYQFTDLAPGTYYVSEAMSSGWEQTYPGGDGIVEIDGVSGAHFAGRYEQTETLNFGNHNGGPGVRTPGFWGSKFGSEFWNDKDDTRNEDGTATKMAGADGIVGTDDDAGFADYELVGGQFGDLLDSAGHVEFFLIGEGAESVAISFDLAHLLINARNKTIGNDGKYILGRDMVATELNLRAGNPGGDAPDDLNEAANWLKNLADANGDDLITDAEFDAALPALTSDPVWQEPQFGNDDSAALLHDQLDFYNNDGVMVAGGLIVTMSSDGDLIFV